jgi:alkaline phosphatase
VATEAKRAGRSVGIITTDGISYATPAPYYAHASSRSKHQEIIDFLPGCGFDILIGNTASLKWFLPKDKKGDRTDTRDVLAEMTGKGYVQVSDIAEFQNAPTDKPVLGFMDSKKVLETESCISEIIEIAIRRLEKNPKGFFMMVEEHMTDGAGHGNNADRTVLGTVQADWAVRSAVEYARTNSDTLVIVTADHETGGLNANMSYGTHEMSILYTTTDHTASPVALYAFGPGAHRFSGVMDNTDIAKKIRELLK